MGSWSDMEASLPTSRSDSPLQVHQSTVQAAVDSAYSEFEEEAQADADEMAEEYRVASEVDRRIRKVNYYNALLRHPLFNNDPSEEAVEVEGEMREFALKQLKAFMGMETAEEAQKTTQFSHEEEVALRVWATRLLADPAVRRAAAEQAPVKPAPQTPKKVLKPALPPPAAEVKLNPLVTTVEAPAAPSQVTAPVKAPPAAKRKAGRPPGKVQAKAAPPAAVTQVTAPNGELVAVQHDTRRPVLPANGRKPMPSLAEMTAQEMTRAAQAEDNNAVLMKFKEITGNE